MDKENIAPIFVKNSKNNFVENCHNSTVIRVIQGIINDVLKLTPQQNIPVKIREILDGITKPKIAQKANSIFYVKMVEKDSPLIPFMENVKNKYEEILSGKYSEFSKEKLEKINELLGFNLSPELFYDVNNPNFANPSVWFSKRTSLYNPAVNFEHVCYIVDLMLDNFLKPSVEILAPFYYFLHLWSNVDDFDFVIYHLIKLIRVNIYAKYIQGVFPPVNSFVNLRFGAITDQNIEVYGDVKLSTKTDSIFSLFTLCPRTPVVKASDSEEIIVYDWNGLNSMTKQFTENLHKPLRPDYPLQVFQQMEKLDISPRISSAKNKKVNHYETVFVDDVNLLKSDPENINRIPEELFNEIARVILSKNISLPKGATKFDNHVIYITFTGTNDTVNTISTHHTLKDLLKLLTEAVPDKMIPITHRQYIPQVHGNFSMASREVITPENTSWENLWREALGIPFPAPKNPFQ